MSYIDSLKSIIPDLTSHLHPASDLLNDFNSRGIELPVEFKQLYQSYNGEKNSGPGIFAGFSWMSLEQIIQTQDLLQKTSINSRYTAEEGLITECEYSDRWIPFAHDYSGNYLALDLLPGPKGQYGQIISLDRDTDETYVIKNSLDDFCHFILSEIKNGHIQKIVEEDSILFNWHSGHLFNDLPEITRPVIKDNVITLSEYWVDYFKNTTIKGQISLSELNSIKNIRITPNKNLGDVIVNLDILQHCQNLTEVICHYNAIESFAPIGRLTTLKKFYVKSQAFNQESMETLAQAKSLIELGLISMNLSSLAPLKNGKLKILALINTQIDDIDSIAMLNNISELRIEGLLTNHLDWIGHIATIKTLELKKLSITCFDFLNELHKLESLTVNDLKVSADYDPLVVQLPKLKRTDWPFSDLTLLKGNTKLESIGIDLDQVKDFSPLKNTHITSVTLVNAHSEKQAKEAIKQIEQFINLTATSWVVNW